MNRPDIERVPVPYKELDYFEETAEDRQSFAGRDREIHEVASRIAVTRAFVLYGRSGLGKTSLLCAGVFPLLREDGFLPVYIRTLEAPLKELEAALHDPLRAPMDPPTLEGESLESLLQRAGGRRTPVLVFDQFEEFFTRFALRTDGYLKKRRDRTDFVNRICALVTNLERDVRIVFSLREDYLHTLDAFQRKLPDLFGHAYRLLPLTAAGAREAIIRPLLRDQVVFQERWATELVNLLAEFDFDSARLQVACAELYRHALAKAQVGEKPELVASDLGQILDSGVAGLHSIFKKYLQAALEKIPGSRHLLARALLDMLFSAKGTKYALSARTMVKYQFGNARETCAVLRGLWKQKILRRQRREGGVWYELRHECLVEPIEEWLDEDEDFANYRLVRDIIRANARDGSFHRRTPLLLSHDQLERLVSPNKQRFRLTETELEFVLLSAIYDCSPEAAWWAEKAGWAMAVEMILDRLRAAEHGKGQRDETMLLGVATVAQELPHANPEIAGRLLQLALDTNLLQTVRRAAGLSIGRHADAALFGQVKKRVRCLGLYIPRPVLELLADLHDAKRMAGNFGPYLRRRAKNRAEKRLMDIGSREIRDAGADGMTAGAAGGLAWVCSSGAVLLMIILNTKEAFFGVWLLCMCLMLVLSPVLGAGYGMLLGRSAAKTKAIRGQFDWARSFRSSKLTIFCLGSTCLPVVDFLPDGFWLDCALIFLLWAGWGWLLACIISLLLCRYRDCLAGAKTIERVWWTIPPTLTLTILFPGVFFTTIGQGWFTEGWAGIYAWSAGFTGWLLTVAATTIGAVDTSVAKPLLPAELKTRGRLRGWSLAGTAAAGAWFLASFGLDSIPRPEGWWPAVPVVGSQVVFAPALSVWPSSAHRVLKNPSLLYTVTEIPSAWKTMIAMRSLSLSNVVFLPLASAVVTVVCESNQLPISKSLVLEPLAVATNEVILVSSNRMMFTLIQFTNIGQTRWEGVLEKRFRSETHTNPAVDVVFFNHCLTGEAGAGDYELEYDSDKWGRKQTTEITSMVGILDSDAATYYGRSDYCSLPPTNTFSHLHLVVTATNANDGMINPPASFSMIVGLIETEPNATK